MKKNVILSTYSWIISILSTIVMVGLLFYTINRQDSLWLIGSIATILIILFMSALFYMPLSISTDSKYLYINRPLKIKSIPLSEIADIKLCQPTMGAIRICGSGGWFGWYGYFSEADLGKYFAYYGKASDCFLVTLKNGKKYMLGCIDAPLMVQHIKKQIIANL